MGSAVHRAEEAMREAEQVETHPRGGAHAARVLQLPPPRALHARSKCPFASRFAARGVARGGCAQAATQRAAVPRRSSPGRTACPFCKLNAGRTLVNWLVLRLLQWQSRVVLLQSHEPLASALVQNECPCGSFQRVPGNLTNCHFAAWLARPRTAPHGATAAPSDHQVTSGGGRWPLPINE